MSWESCIVFLNSDSIGFFYAGDLVTGSVMLEFKQDQKIETINFKVIGKCKAHWSRPMPTVPYIKVYSEKKVIFECNVDVFEELVGKQVKAGVRSYYFHFALPLDLPSSFEDSIARMNYFIKIEGKSCFKFKKEKRVPFTVYASVNLNHIEDYLTPTYHECFKIFWNYKKILVTIKTYKGFAPRQYVPIEMVLINENKVNITKITVSLIQKLRFNVSSGYANEEKKKCKAHCKKLSGTLTETCFFGMEIPQTMPSTLNLTQQMIDISYVLRVEIVFPFHSRLIEDVPIAIATVPLIHHNFNEK